MSKVLYVGHMNENSGWTEAAVGLILALDSVGVDVVVRSLDLNDKKAQLPERIVELMSKPSRGCDVCIQHVLPQFMEYNGKFKNIAYYVDEVLHTKYDYTNKLNLMDEVWVPNTLLQHDAKLRKEPKLVPHAFDMSKLHRNYEPFYLDKGGDFCFYTIADLHRRKNIVGLIQAFAMAFESHEPVKLVLKVSHQGMSPDEVKSNLNKLSEQAKSILFTKKDYKKEVVISKRLSEEEILQMHNSMDCFVLPSFGEGWCIPAFEAMAFGRYPVITDNGGPTDYINDYENGYLVHCHEEPVIGAVDILKDVYNSNNTWFKPDLSSLVHAMRFAYTELSREPEREEIKRNSYKQAEKYSYENVGQIMKDLL